jgi:hypothetical protein
VRRARRRRSSVLLGASALLVSPLRRRANRVHTARRGALASSGAALGMCAPRPPRGWPVRLGAFAQSPRPWRRRAPRGMCARTRRCRWPVIMGLCALPGRPPRPRVLRARSAWRGLRRRVRAERGVPPGCLWRFPARLGLCAVFRRPRWRVPWATCAWRAPPSRSRARRRITAARHRACRSAATDTRAR